MLKTIVPATLEFKEGVPYSTPYGDIYHAAAGGEGQARHVFLQGCGLPQAWVQQPSFVMLETGFGTGLNFLLTWAAWRADPARSARLHFLSVEMHPFQADDLARLHAQWPELSDLSRELLVNWPMLTPGFHRIALDGGRVQLTLMLGDATDCLPQVQAAVDAFYLDGFAPERNAALWQPSVFKEVARLAKPGAVVATYTVMGAVRQGLTEAGFACVKRDGFGGKRHCLSARYTGESNLIVSAPPKHVAIIGAGVAGAALAHALAQHGVAVTVLERGAELGSGASGNPMAVYRPMLSRDDNRASRLTRAAFLHNLRAWTALGENVKWSRCGVLHLPKDEITAAKQHKALDNAAPPVEFARWVELDEARELANWPVDGAGLFFPSAGWVEPVSLCRAWLDHPAIQLRTNCTVERLHAHVSGWQVLDDKGSVLIEVDAVVLANARDVMTLVPAQTWPLHTERGQITQLPAGCLPEIQRVIAREGYIAPGAFQPLVGATYEHDDDDTMPRRESDLANLARLEAILPGAGSRFNEDDVIGRASLRALLPDRLPIVGAVTGQNGVYVAAGYASRGVVWAGLLGEALADQMTGQPLPVEMELMRIIAPDRFKR
ncbi:MAG: bifunctional tRNA (5-methylaminomethyl-2-thiouridine)(34)-methyltransferase MnmD/FAD-dependent 5-carboxymethylaminomethyl-2-thiouridine(34) oxidoreductase MnmC [Thiobacillus sp.]|nr:bifunctional tRNA (5-methylaminomethyl-2-thiouridine)(34)-methyltransferase MnmD/FAD-dependent 5-carboxymethylaminomethyl-2-thiouridine(34) oxidoreductase MnmC [Thiobacillus sp.]